MISFFGAGLDREVYDELAFRSISKKWLDNEVALFGTKWFDYRHMHPAEATYLYAHHLNQAFKNIWTKTISSKVGPDVKILKGEDLFKDNTKLKIAGVWHGRQVADVLGMPYDLFTQLAYYHATRFWQQKRLPNVSQLYSDRVVEMVSRDWTDRQGGALYVAEEPIYRNERYRGTAAQDAHHEWLMKIACLRANPAPYLGKFTFDDRVLPEEKIVSRFGADMAASARSYSMSSPVAAAL